MLLSCERLKFSGSPVKTVPFSDWIISLEFNNHFYLLESEIETKDYTEYLLKVLDARERVIIRLRFGINFQEQTFKSIAKLLEISTTRVQQIFFKAIQKLQFWTSISKYAN